MANALNFLFAIFEDIATLMLTPPFSIFLAIILLVLAIKIIKIITTI